MDIFNNNKNPHVDTNINENLNYKSSNNATSYVPHKHK